MELREANSPERWDALWEAEGRETWRARALGPIYDRIVELMPEHKCVMDIGGGVGILAMRLRQERQCSAVVLDQSEEAVRQCREAGVTAVHACIGPDDRFGKVTHEASWPDDGREYHGLSEIVVATEFLEHVASKCRGRIYEFAATCESAMFSVPHDCLGPDEEPQHDRRWTAKEWLDELRGHFEHARVEVFGRYMLGVVGELAKKPFRLSVCTPARDEEADLAETLASFRGVADELVVGVDPRTEDGTREVAEKYADLVFDLADPEGPPDERMPDGGVHFAWIRNQCMNRCTGDWIFMTEAHERLGVGTDVLLALEQIPEAARVACVLRTDGKDQQWGFPWLCRNDPRIRYKRSTHNVLGWPPGSLVVKLPQIKTIHERVHARAEARAEQRRVQNRRDLLDDWLQRQNENSLYYLASEWRGSDLDRSEARFRELLSLPAKNGAMRYQARLILSKMLAMRGDRDEAVEVLHGCTAEDWMRTEHWLWLGDLTFLAGRLEEALQFYLYAGTRIGLVPFTLWWIDLNHYSYLPAQRLAMCYSELGMLEESLQWAERVTGLYPTDYPAKMFDEARANVAALQEAIDAAA